MATRRRKALISRSRRWVKQIDTEKEVRVEEVHNQYQSSSRKDIRFDPDEGYGHKVLERGIDTT